MVIVLNKFKLKQPKQMDNCLKKRCIGQNTIIVHSLYSVFSIFFLERVRILTNMNIEP